jgi:hypothetical protein
MPSRAKNQRSDWFSKSKNAGRNTISDRHFFEVFHAARVGAGRGAGGRSAILNVSAG